ncbi:hypothetical protein CMK11_12785 [Candidatus Poribacteria bacterium]|nr:hypothetical protein [Candidatus Poribacteria bacterium]
MSTPDLRYVDVMTLDGRDRGRVTDGLGPDGIFPAWTPDGEISFVLARGTGDYQVAVTGLRGGDEEVLTDTPTEKTHLAWYSSRWFPVQALAALQPKLWARLKR